MRLCTGFWVGMGAGIMAGAAVGMMLDIAFGLKEEAAAVDRAINAVLHDGYRTPDIYRGGPGQIRTTTEEMGVQTAARISK